MLKVAPCTVVHPNFFGLMGYYYFVQLWGYALRAPLSTICLRCRRTGWKYASILTVLSCELMEPTIEISVEYLFFVLDYGVTHGCTIHVTKHLAADGSIIPHETSKCNGQEFERLAACAQIADRPLPKETFTYALYIGIPYFTLSGIKIL